MCLITLSWQPAETPTLTVAANRDEFYVRPTLALHHWPRSNILAGKDALAGGTWLGVSQHAGTGHMRFAALTNYREASGYKVDAPSRGHITTSFLSGSMSAASYLAELSSHASSYNPFNLIVFDGQQLMGFESRNLRGFSLSAGITSVSNADFNTPWPKLVRLHHDFEQTLAVRSHDDALDKELFFLLANDIVVPDADLPQTGIALARERALSAAFVRMPDYGTRACSVLQMTRHTATFSERSFDASGLTSEVKKVFP